MAATLSLQKRRQSGGRYLAHVGIVFSGSYPTGGDTVDFAAVSGLTNRKPDVVTITGQAGYLYQWDKANNKVLVFGGAAAAGAAFSQFTSGAYSATLTGDTVLARCEWLATPYPGS